jgi:hypothetical protein
MGKVWSGVAEQSGLFLQADSLFHPNKTTSKMLLLLLAPTSPTMARLFEVNMHIRMHDDINGHMGDVSWGRCGGVEWSVSLRADSPFHPNKTTSKMLRRPTYPTMARHFEFNRQISMYNGFDLPHGVRL